MPLITGFFQTIPYEGSPAADRVSPAILRLLLLLFVGSGACALIYEVVWFQLLELVIGSSAISGPAPHRAPSQSSTGTRALLMGSRSTMGPSRGS